MNDKKIELYSKINQPSWVVDEAMRYLRKKDLNKSNQEIIDRINQIIKSKDLDSKVINPDFYANFNYSKELVDKAILTLHKNDLKVINKFLNNPGTICTKGIKKIIEKINNIIREDVCKNSLYDLYPQFSKEEVRDAFNKLPIKYKERITKLYTIDNSVEVKEELEDRYSIKYALKLLNDILNKVEKDPRDRYINIKYVGFFSQLSEYPINQVLEIIKTIPIEDINLLKKKYGNDFTNIERVELTKEESLQINTRIVHNIRRKLEKLNTTHKLFYISDEFNGYSLEEIKSALERTNTIKYASNIYGEDLSNPVLIRRDMPGAFAVTIKERVTKALKNKMNLNKVILIKPFYEIFIKYKKTNETYEDFITRVNNLCKQKLDNIELEILKKKYGEEYNNIVYHGQITLEEQNVFFHKITPKIKHYLSYEPKERTTTYKSFIDRLPVGTTKEEIEEVLKTVSDRELNTIKSMLGENLDAPLNICSYPLTTVKRVGASVRRIRNKIMISRHNKVLEIIKNKRSEYTFINEMCGEKLAIAIILYTYSDFSKEAIEDYTGINEENILNGIEELKTIRSNLRVLRGEYYG